MTPNNDHYRADDLDDWIDSLLRSPEAARVEAPPTTLIPSLRTVLAQRRRQRLRTASSLVSAAVLLIALGWIVLNHQAQRPAAPEPSSIAAVQPEINPAPESPRATFTTNGETIAVPLESSAPDVSIVLLYPTTDTELRWRLEWILQNTKPHSNGG